MELYQSSIQVILTHQAASGAYPACPNFPTYLYSWFRDGAFIAHAMDVAGQRESAQRFHDWAAHTVLHHAEAAERAIQKAGRGEPLGEDYLHTRHTLDGEVGMAEWPDFQLDGLGAWLWALQQHIQRAPAAGRGFPPLHWWQAVKLVARYLAALWSYPCYDLWEEHPQCLHPYTLAAIYAGLRAAERIAACAGQPLGLQGRAPSEVAEEIRSFVLQHGVQQGHLAKQVRPPAQAAAPGGRLAGGSSPPDETEEPAVADGSLVGVASPFRLLPPQDPIMQATVARIEADLHCPGGGVHRYLADTYYGGGEWVLLAAWLGWYYKELGEWERARELLRWVEAQADTAGHLPEQVPTHLLAPDRYGPWEARWGPVARPLLWSHAMHLLLYRALAVVREE